MSDADFYQEHKDDPDEWEDAPEERRPARRLGSMISARFSAAEVVTIREAAEARGQSVSSFIRDVALAAARRDQHSTCSFTDLALSGSMSYEFARLRLVGQPVDGVYVSTSAVTEMTGV